MIILAIDTSCDDTCIAIVEADKRGYQRRLTRRKFKILSNVVSSQVKIHRKYGGVYPSLAKREHQKNLPVVLKKALRKARLSEKKPKIDAVAITVGPGLDPCLWTGINFAKDLAQQWNLPIIPVNHIEAHIFANFLDKFRKLFPAICLVVSGGHTQLILVKKIGDYKIVGETRDDAAGECFDKTARVLGLPYPGGPAIAAEAARFKVHSSKFKIKLPRPMINTKDYDFSFSGLKTAVLYEFKKRSKKVRVSKEYVREMAKEIQQAIIDVLTKKTIKAAKNYPVKTIMLGGGVAANTELRKQFKLKIKKSPKENQRFPTGQVKLRINFWVPLKNLCTDNAVMIGATAYFHRKEASKKWQKIEAKANLRI